MIDLHIHSKYSDGTNSVKEILTKAQNYNLDYISITDHNTCMAYEELKKINISNYYNGKIISGIEMNTKIMGIPIEVLGYKIDTDKMDKIVKDLYPTAKERNFIELKRIYKKCIEANIKIDKKVIDEYDGKSYTSKYLHSILTNNEDNKKLIDNKAWEDCNYFYRKYMSNPKSIFYVNMDDILPDFKTVYSKIKQADGLLFLPHIFEYNDNSMKILNNVLNNYKIDGIECFYTTFSKEQNSFLLNLAKEQNLFISGGSDYHGDYKPNVDMAIGLGKLSIPTTIIENWK